MSTKSSLSLVSDQGPVSASVALSAKSSFAGPVDMTASNTSSTPQAVLNLAGTNVYDVPEGATYVVGTPRLSANSWTPGQFRVWGVDGNGFLYPIQNVQGDFNVACDGTVRDTGSALANSRYTAEESAAGQMVWDVRGASKILFYVTVAATANGAFWPKFL